MLQNRIVRALVGVVFTKAAVAAGWYLYQKSLKDEAQKGKNKGLFSEDMNALEKKPSVRVHDLGPALDQVKDYLQAKEKQLSTSTLDVPTETKPKRVRRPAAPKVVTTSETEKAAPKARTVAVKTAPKKTAVKSEVAAKTAVAKPKKAVATKTVAAKKAVTKTVKAPKA